MDIWNDEPDAIVGYASSSEGWIYAAFLLAFPVGLGVGVSVLLGGTAAKGALYGLLGALGVVAIAKAERQLLPPQDVRVQAPTLPAV